MPAEDLAFEYERRHKEQARRMKMQGEIYGGVEGSSGRVGSSAVMQQSLLPRYVLGCVVLYCIV